MKTDWLALFPGEPLFDVYPSQPMNSFHHLTGNKTISTDRSDMGFCTGYAGSLLQGPVPQQVGQWSLKARNRPHFTEQQLHGLKEP